MKSILLVLYTLALTAVFFYTNPNITKAESCSTNGFCDTLCGAPGNYACSYADCGNGTELCTTDDDVKEAA